MKRRAILLHKDHPALLRARRKYARWGERKRALYRSRRIRVEGIHGEAKTWHGLARAVRRGLTNMQIQAYLTAAAVNLKRLVAALLLLLLAAALTAASMIRTRPSPALAVARQNTSGPPRRAGWA
jgi:Transposase DDE domain